MASEFVTKDSGVREEWATGSRRDSRQGKGRYDLLSPLALRRITGVLERGAAKYGDRNWEKGQPLSRYADSALRHLFQWIEGKRDEDHLGQAAWNLLAALHTEEAIDRGRLPAELNDLPDYTPMQEASAPLPPSDEAEGPTENGKTVILWAPRNTARWRCEGPIEVFYHSYNFTCPTCQPNPHRDPSTPL